MNKYTLRYISLILYIITWAVMITISMHTKSGSMFLTTFIFAIVGGIFVRLYWRMLQNGK